MHYQIFLASKNIEIGKDVTFKQTSFICFFHQYNLSVPLNKVKHILDLVSGFQDLLLSFNDPAPPPLKGQCTRYCFFPQYNLYLPPENSLKYFGFWFLDFCNFTFAKSHSLQYILNSFRDK